MHTYLGEYGRALESYDRALALDKDSSVIWFNKGLGTGPGLYEQAVEAFSRAIAIAPKMAAAWVNRGIFLRRLHRHAEAAESYDRAILLDPRNSAWFNKSAELIREGSWEAALKAIDITLSIRVLTGSAGM